MSFTVSSELQIWFREAGDFAAAHAAEAFLERAGFSLGRMQAHEPRGILYGNFDIQKWRNLNPAQREALHGQMTGDMRNGPVVVEIFDSAPADALAALSSCVEVSRTEQAALAGPGSLSRSPRTLGASHQ